MINLIVAVDKSNSIGWSNGSLPWKIPLDMARFKHLTMGHDVIMGWNTFVSLGNPEGLPGRRNLVLTRKPFEVLAPFWGIDPNTVTTRAVKWKHLPVQIYNGIEAVLEHQMAIGIEPKDLWLIGGAQIYEQAIKFELVDKIFLTQVHTDSKADVKFTPSLYDYEQFIKEQDAVGVKWVVDSVETPIVLVGTAVTFVTLSKVK